MKIYIDGLSSQHVEISKLNEVKNDIIKYIYSKKGIYIILKNQIKSCVIRDMPVKTVTVNQYKMLIDNSEITMDKLEYHIPLNHIQDTVTKTIYKISRDLSLIVELGSISSENIYFESLSNYIPHITDEIHSFLCDKVNL